MKTDRMYVLHIQECIQRIEEYTQDGRDAFYTSTLIQDAVARNFEIIGEATKRLSAHIKQKYPEPPWRQIAGLRDVLIHNYMGVDVHEVWNIVEHALPDLNHAIAGMLEEVTDDDASDS